MRTAKFAATGTTSVTLELFDATTTPTTPCASYNIFIAEQVTQTSNIISKQLFTALPAQILNLANFQQNTSGAFSNIIFSGLTQSWFANSSLYAFVGITCSTATTATLVTTVTTK